jgi:hypothetical protein
LSPDGKWIAFVSRDEQHPEVPHAGGRRPRAAHDVARPDVMVRGFTADGRLPVRMGNFRNYRAYTLDPAVIAADATARSGEPSVVVPAR